MGKTSLDGYFAEPPKDPLDAQLRLEVATVAELLTDEGRRAVAFMGAVVGEDGSVRCCALLSSMAEDEREKVARALIVALESEFGGRSI